MNRKDLEHLIRAAATVTNEYELVIVGSQSILGSIPYPPDELKMSAEADMYPLNAEGKSIELEGALGEGSPFHTTFGYYAQGVDSNYVNSARGLEGQAASSAEPGYGIQGGFLPGRARPFHG